jgi:hypothetical protein
MCTVRSHALPFHPPGLMPPMTQVTFDSTNTLIRIFDSYDDSVINGNLNTPIGVLRLTKRLKSVLKIYF